MTNKLHISNTTVRCTKAGDFTFLAIELQVAEDIYVEPVRFRWHQPHIIMTLVVRPQGVIFNFKLYVVSSSGL
ncbi:MAG: hypothetical protein WDO15_26030 [Bacteroidota bacterium]